MTHSKTTSVPRHFLTVGDDDTFGVPYNFFQNGNDVTGRLFVKVSSAHLLSMTGA